MGIEGGPIQLGVAIVRNEADSVGGSVREGWVAERQSLFEGRSGQICARLSMTRSVQS